MYRFICRNLFCYGYDEQPGWLRRATCNMCQKTYFDLYEENWKYVALFTYADPTNVGDPMDVSSSDMDDDYDDNKDRYKSSTELWGEKVKRIFNISMRLDAMSGTNIGSVRPTRSVVGKFQKVMKGKVRGIKGGRKSGGQVMGESAKDFAKRGQNVAVHQSEEWLHLWGDNLGGKSEKANFVAGSYAANTEMLAIEQELALNLPKTKGIKLEITAKCSNEHVGEYIIYKVIDFNLTTPFIHIIDLDNRYFSRSDMIVVKDLIRNWLIYRNLINTPDDPINPPDDPMDTT